MTPSTVVVVASYYYYYATFNAPCIGHRDDESQAQAMIGLLRRTLLWHFKCQIYAHKAEVQSMNNEHENTPHSAYIFSVPVASVGAGIRELTRPQKKSIDHSAACPAAEAAACGRPIYSVETAP